MNSMRSLVTFGLGLVFSACATTSSAPPPPAQNAEAGAASGTPTATGATGEAAAAATGSPVPAGTIQLVAATYGANCGAAHGNVTAHIAKQCDGQATCEYKVDYQVIGDPAVGCGKEYLAEWRCGGDERVHQAHAPREAGYGAIVALSCPPR